jgi:hypothetical protein
MGVDLNKPVTAEQLLRVPTCELVHFIATMATRRGVASLAQQVLGTPFYLDPVMERNAELAGLELDQRIPPRAR